MFLDFNVKFDDASANTLRFVDMGGSENVIDILDSYIDFRNFVGIFNIFKIGKKRTGKSSEVKIKLYSRRGKEFNAVKGRISVGKMIKLGEDGYKNSFFYRKFIELFPWEIKQGPNKTNQTDAIKNGWNIGVRVRQI